MFIVTDSLTFLPNYEYWSVCFKNPDPLLISVLNAGVLKHDLNTVGLLPFYCTTLCKNKFQTFWPLKIFKICKHRRPQLWYNIWHGISLLYEWSRNVGTFTGSITAPVLVVGKHFHSVAYAYCVRCYSRSLELGWLYHRAGGVKGLKGIFKNINNVAIGSIWLQWLEFVILKTILARSQPDR